jgi:hypothetical protein
MYVLTPPPNGMIAELVLMITADCTDFHFSQFFSSRFADALLTLFTAYVVFAILSLLKVGVCGVQWQ